MILSFLRDRINQITTFLPPSEVEDPSSLPPRRVLVIHCHPRKESYSTALSAAVVSGLSSSGHQVRLRRLYYQGAKEECYGGDSFDPVLTMGPTIHATTAGRASPAEASKILDEAIDDLRWCNSMVFIYPTWWMNFPAMLKGYFDRVLVPGVAFKPPGMTPGLTHIDKLAVVTTYGGPAPIVHLAGDNSRRFLSLAFRHLCAPTCTLLWKGQYDMNNSTPEQREAFLAEVRRSFSHF